jgi:hypothetical protein
MAFAVPACTISAYMFNDFEIFQKRAYKNEYYANLARYWHFIEVKYQKNS